MVARAAAEQVTQEELAIIHAIRDLCRRGYGELTVKVHENKVARVWRAEDITPKPDTG